MQVVENIFSMEHFPSCGITLNVLNQSKTNIVDILLITIFSVPIAFHTDGWYNNRRKGNNQQPQRSKEMELNELINTIANLNRNNGAFYGFETLTTPHLTKKNRTTKEPTTFVVTIRATFSAMLGVSYENAVNNALERKGEERTFEAQKPFGKHYVGDSKWLMTDDKTESKFYLALDCVGGVKKTFYIDGREATEAEIADLKENYLDKPSANNNGVKWRTYSTESILSVK